jgi:predicted PurR-regulated permease PerM
MQVHDPGNRLKPAGADDAALIEKAVLLLLFLGLLAGVLMVLKPFGVGLMFGGIIAIAAWPLRQGLTQRGVSPGATAALLLLGALALVLVPVLLLGPGLAGRLVHLLDLVRAWLAQSPEPPAWLAGVPLVGKPAQAKWIEILPPGANPYEALAPYIEPVRAAFLSAARGVGDSLVQLILSLVIAAMLWAQGDLLSATAMDVLDRLGGGRLSGMAVLAAHAVRGVFYGVVGTACIQAVLMGGGLWLAGVPAAVPIGFVTLLLALSQIGAPLIHLVWAGAAYWLHARGQAGLVLWFVVGWGILVALLDNVLKPWLIGSSIEMPLALVILGVFGGFLSFGFLGLFIGPVLIAIAYALLVAWRAETRAGPAAGRAPGC